MFILNKIIDEEKLQYHRYEYRTSLRNTTWLWPGCPHSRTSLVVCTCTCRHIVQKKIFGKATLFPHLFSVSYNFFIFHNNKQTSFMSMNFNSFYRQLYRNNQNFQLTDNYYCKILRNVVPMVKYGSSFCMAEIPRLWRKESTKPTKDLGDNTFVIEWFAGINWIILWSQI